MAQDYVFMTDSDSDLLFTIADKRGIPVVKMPYMLDGVEYFDDGGRTGQEKRLFARMREGSAPNTSLLPQPVYMEYFEPILKEKDLLFVAFSSQMSATIQNVYAAREELLAKYPQRRFTVVDTLSISAPMTLLLEAAHDRYLAGASMDEVEQFLRDNRLRANAFFTVDNLVYLKRGGRISPTSAFLGTMLDLKPVLTLSRAGRIEAIAKVQGRRKALRTLVEKTAENIEGAEGQEALIVHGDCEQEAAELEHLLRARLPELKAVRVQMVGPVIGAHCGPGVLCIAFMGRERAQ